MSGLVRTAHRVMQTCVKSTGITGAIVSRTQTPVKRDFTRGIWHMSCSTRMDSTSAASSLLNKHSNTCSCGCGLKALHTKGMTVINPLTDNFEVKSSFSKKSFKPHSKYYQLFNICIADISLVFQLFLRKQKKKSVTFIASFCFICIEFFNH